jgi:hypothetical protein
MFSPAESDIIFSGTPDEDQMKRMSSSSCCRSLIALIALVALSALASPIMAAPEPAAAQAAYNGSWSVLIVTERGPCDRAYRYPVRVTDGRVTYGGQADFNVSGRVMRNGAVNVSVSRGGQRAAGSGRLAGTTGSGTWRGGSGSDACSGSWTAEKRG